MHLCEDDLRSYEPIDKDWVIVERYDEREEDGMKRSRVGMDIERGLEMGDLGFRQKRKSGGKQVRFVL